MLFHGNGKVAHAGQSEARLTMRALGGKERTDIEGVYSDASSLQSKLRTLGIHVADDAMVDVLGMCLYASPFFNGVSTLVGLLLYIRRCIIFISAWASKLLIFTWRQVRRPGL